MQQDVLLRKSVEVVLPHCVSGLKGGEHNGLELGFLKANHHEVVSGSEEQNMYTFHPLEGKVKFTSSCGTIQTQHFCFLCIKAQLSRELVQRSGYCLSRVIPHPWPASQPQIFIYFCVTYFMKTCLSVSCPTPNSKSYFVHMQYWILDISILQMIDRQYSTGFRIEPREFCFASATDNKLLISIERDIPKGWFAILEDSEVWL